MSACKKANTEKIYQVTDQDIFADNEVCCPPLNSCLWNSHPRVYIRLNDKGEARCPYCSTVYIKSETTTLLR